MDAGFRLLIPLDFATESRAVPASAVLFLLVLAPLAGRVFLAWLPPGLPGRHAPRDLPATWAASFLIGLTWFAWIETVVPRGPLAFVALGIPALALVARILTSPAGLIPRHEPVPERAPMLGRFGVVIAVFASAWIGTRGEVFDAGGLTGTSCFAAAFLLNEALSIARVPSWIRVLALTLNALALFVARTGDEATTIAVLGACGIALGAVGWIRRGDRRALALASIAILLLAHLGPSGIPIALGTGVCLVIASAKPSRRLAFLWIAGAFVVGVLPRLGLGADGTTAGVVEQDPEWFERVPIGALLVIVAVTVVLRIRRDPPALNPSGAPLHREIEMLTCGAFLAHFLVPAIGALPVAWTTRLMPLPEPTLSFRVLLILVAAIALARALERRPRTT